ncbi:MAG TPA: hypothetical protein VMC05_15105 [Xanthobacteraceae bacterium]|nr:hypothetical protein [Xanthobacteraceae bacterium]
MDQSSGHRSREAEHRSRAPGGKARRQDQSQEKHQKQRQEQRKEELDDALDVGLEETFPASDPVSVVQPPANIHEKDDFSTP